MATIQTSFKSRVQTQKGEIGEKIVRDFLEGLGYKVYPHGQEGAHPFDMVVVKGEERFICEVKSKSKMSMRPETGVDERHFQVYKKAQETTGMPVVMCFVDEDEGNIYGNLLDELELMRFEKERDVPYPHTITDKYGQKLHLWHRNSMITYGKIPEDMRRRLYEANTRKYPQPSEYNAIV